jgi:hypothetical protein
VTFNDVLALIKTLADLIVYVWMFSLTIALLLGKSLNHLGYTFRTLPGLWSPPVLEPINQSSRFAIEQAETFLLLGGLLLMRGTRDFVVVTLIALLVDCLNVLFLIRLHRNLRSNNILFTYLGFLLFRGYFEVGIIAFLMTILVGCLCSKMLWEMVPLAGDTVWKGHLASFVGGAVTARFLDAIAALLPVSKLW